MSDRIRGADDWARALAGVGVLDGAMAGGHTLGEAGRFQATANIGSLAGMPGLSAWDEARDGLDALHSSLEAVASMDLSPWLTASAVAQFDRRVALGHESAADAFAQALLCARDISAFAAGAREYSLDALADPSRAAMLAIATPRGLLQNADEFSVRALQSFEIPAVPVVDWPQPIEPWAPPQSAIESEALFGPVSPLSVEPARPESRLDPEGVATTAVRLSIRCVVCREERSCRHSVDEHSIEVDLPPFCDVCAQWSLDEPEAFSLAFRMAIAGVSAALDGEALGDRAPRGKLTLVDDEADAPSDP